MLSTSLIQIYVNSQTCVPYPLFDLRQHYGGGNEDNHELLRKVPCMPCSLGAPNPVAGLQGRFLDTHGQVCLGSCVVSAPFSWVLLHKLLFVLFKSLFLQSCVCSCGSVVGLMLPSSKRDDATPRSAAPRAPAPEAVHC